MMCDTQKDDALGSYGTPELHSLFNDWLLQLEEEIIALSEHHEVGTPEAVAESLKISVESATFILDRLAQKQSSDGKKETHPQKHDKENEGK
jgi:hypothetical protein